MSVRRDTKRSGRPDAEALDAADGLADFQRRYLPQTPDVIAYLDGNSLGRPLGSIAETWSDFAREQWAGRLIRGWSEGWMELPEAVGDELAAAALGAAPGQTVIADSTTVNFYKALRAAINLRPGRRTIVSDRDNFPTNRYVVESLARDLGLRTVWLSGTDPGGPGADGVGADRVGAGGPRAGGISVEDVRAVLDEDTAVLTLSHVAYHSGYLADARAITAAAHAVGAVVVWDLCHSVGAVPVALDDWEADFAVGCTYKFVGAGPGAPAFSYVNRAHHARLDQPIWGWLGRRDSFEMEQGYLPAAGIRSMISGTPPVPGILAVREGTKVIAEAGIDAIRAKGVALTEMVIALADQWLLPLGFGLGSPRNSDRRGAHVSITRPDARDVCARLVSMGVLPDFRTPDAIRIGLSPLSTSFVAVWEAIAVIRDVARA